MVEDRALNLGIRENGYKLSYLPDAIAWINPIKTLPELLAERKRLINGSSCSFDKTKDTLSCGGFCFCCLRLQTLFLTFINLFAFVAPSIFLFAMHISMLVFRQDVLSQLDNIFPPDSLFFDAFVFTIDFIYILYLAGIVVKSVYLKSDNSRFIPFIYIASSLFGLFTIIIFIMLIYDLVSNFLGNPTCTYRLI